MKNFIKHLPFGKVNAGLWTKSVSLQTLTACFYNGQPNF